MDKVLVLGAGFAGTNAALKLSRRGFHVEVIDVNSYHEFTPGIINLYRNRVPETNLKRDLHHLFDRKNIEFSREVVNDIRPRERVVETNAGTHEYKYLVVALGSQPRTYGMDLSGVFKPYDLESTKKIVDELDDADSVSVVGSGYVGIEIAAEINELGRDVTVIESGTRPMSKSNKKASDKALDYLNRNDISLRIGNRAESIENGTVRLENGKEVESDLVLWAGGVKASDTVTEALNAGPEGVAVDERLRYPQYKNIFVAADSADTDYLKTAHNATEQGRYIGRNLGKKDENMKPYSSGNTPLLVGLGKTGMMVYGDRAAKSPVFRYMKDAVRKRYWFQLKRMKYIG